MKIQFTLLYLAVLLILNVLGKASPHKCQSNQNMKYDLNHTSQLRGYFSVCSDFTRRTCCSGKNFDALAKKISNKLVAADHQSISLNCRRRLTNLLCSTCDGDIGQKSVDGVCLSVCQNVYETCKDDFFSIDSLNKIKACRQDDIICSKLSDILSSSAQSQYFCEMLGIEVSLHDCWKGSPSSNTKGVPKRKVNYHGSETRAKNTSRDGPTILQRLFRKVETKHLVYFGFVGLLFSILSYKWLSAKLKNQSRKIKNL